MKKKKSLMLKCRIILKESTELEKEKREIREYVGKEFEAENRAKWCKRRIKKSNLAGLSAL